ncbi:MAG: hypothetical protein M9933_09010 [Chitinophagaceae bacterium]|nr:hypothetical protein [Chitinophagaceae bacterium]
MIVLRKLFIVFLIPFLANTVFGQEQYYIYIQSEEHRAFYVRVEGETYTSSGTGYLVIPGLEKNTYELIIGYPGEKPAEWRFNCSINTTDLGFVLKQDKRSGVQLLNLKEQNGITGTPVQQQRDTKADQHPAVAAGTVSNDPFSSMLAEVVNDPSIRKPVIVEQKMAAAVEPPKTDSVKSMVAAIPPADKKKEEKTTATASPVKEDSVKALIAKTSPVGKPTSSGKVAESLERGDTGHGTGTVVKDEAGKPEPKEVEKAEEVKTAEESPKDIVAKTDKANRQDGKPVKEKTQSEPFVIKETPMEKNESVENTSPSVETPKEEKNANEEVKYLPFAVAPSDKPVDASGNKQQSNKDQKTSAKTEQKTGVAKDSETAPSDVKKEKGNDEEMKYLPFEIKPGQDPEHTAIAQPVAVENKSSSPSLPAEKKEEAIAIPDTEAAKIDIEKKNEKANVVPPGTVEKKAASSSVRKTMERKSRDGVDLIYIDEDPGGARDTIRIFIPAVK